MSGKLESYARLLAWAKFDTFSLFVQNMFGGEANYIETNWREFVDAAKTDIAQGFVE